MPRAKKKPSRRKSSASAIIGIRICKDKYSTKELGLLGKGTEVVPNRWTYEGETIRVCFAAGSLSQAKEELFGNLRPAEFPDGYAVFQLRWLKRHMKKLDLVVLEKDWNLHPYTRQTRKLGMEFLAEGKFAVYQLPSALTPGESVFMFNCSHPDYVNWIFPRSKFLGIYPTDTKKIEARERELLVRKVINARAKRK